MEIQKTFELSCSPDVVWDAFADVHLIADCLPGASILEQLEPNRYKGRFSVKVGPLAAAFEGDITVERRPEDRAGIVAGKGADARSSSRASGQMSYRVEAAETPDRTRVSVNCEINLAGALAQFGKAAVIREIANRLTAEFVRNFEARLATRISAEGSPLASVSAASAASTQAQRQQSLDAGKLAWSIFWDRLVSLFRALLGGRARQ